MIYWPTKQPTTVMDYGMDWRPVVRAIGDSPIVASVWERLSGDVEFLAKSITDDGTKTNIRLRGGTSGVENILRCTVTFANGLSLSKRAFILVRTST